MWQIMVLLYPELWDKFGEDMPTPNEMILMGFPKEGDITSKYFMEWLVVVHTERPNISYSEWKGTDEEFEIHKKNWDLHWDLQWKLHEEVRNSLTGRLLYLTEPYFNQCDCR